MVFRPWYSLYATAAAVVGGVLLAMGSYVGGAIVVALAFWIVAAQRRVEKRGEDDTFTLK
jgi:HAMP domain-containing protein